MGPVARVKQRIPQPWRTIVEWATTLGAALAIVLVFQAEIAKPYRIPSSSMEPTLHCAKPGEWCLGTANDRIVANRLAYRFGDPERGQIVVFEAPPAASRCGSSEGEAFVKRLIGLPGDHIEERDGYIFVNGERLAEPYIAPALRGHDHGSWTVPEGQYFFLGDDRAHSCDSRTWGTVSRDHLIGPVVLTYWPPDRIGLH